MGMFDLVRCEYPLPDPEHQHDSFECKGTPEQGMEQYTITADGRLIHNTTTKVWRDEVPPSYPGARILDLIPAGDVEVPFHGDLWIIGDRHDNDEPFPEYVVTFTQGRVTHVERVKEDG